MADINHSSLTDPNLHEPKGCATAENGMMYVANGAGSGQWKYIPTGWGYYKDDDTAQNFTATAAKLTLDAAHADTLETYLPNQIRGSSSLWDGTNDLMTPIAIGDVYDIRLDLPITNVSATTLISLTLDTGGSATITDSHLTHTIPVPASTPYTISIDIHVVVDSAFLTNGLQFFLEADSGNFDVTKPAVLITRVHGGDL